VGGRGRRGISALLRFSGQRRGETRKQERYKTEIEKGKRQIGEATYRLVVFAEGKTI